MISFRDDATPHRAIYCARVTGSNRLRQEASPYLRQHADNPVDWWPWCDDAFAEARQRDVPVLLSVGYSACHWCHVMAHESFEDDATAAVMNTVMGQPPWPVMAWTASM